MGKEHCSLSGLNYSPDTFCVHIPQTPADLPLMSQNMNLDYSKIITFRVDILVLNILLVNILASPILPKTQCFNIPTASGKYKVYHFNRQKYMP